MNADLIKIAWKYDLLLTVFILVTAVTAIITNPSINITGIMSSVCHVVAVLCQTSYLLAIQSMIKAKIAGTDPSVASQTTCLSLQVLAIAATISGLFLYIARA